MGQALYRKYRPRSFAEAVGQETVTKTLDEAIRSGRINHAYLFAGPRGVGKTSVARILAHRVNRLPYQDDNIHLDIIEIDAASNRRIDEIRDLREKVHITPASAQYKVYIIDEVHMLTKEAFNALLKTLEEPPAHCIFILATTEPHKLPETIISRTQRFNFKPISQAAAKARLKKIAKQEKIKIDEKAIDLLAEHGDGSLRDVVGMLDQLRTFKKNINEADVRDLLGVPPLKTIDELLGVTALGDPASALKLLDKLKEQAISPVSVAKTLSTRARQRILRQPDESQWLTFFLKELVTVSASANPQEALELAVLEASAKNSSNSEQPPPPSQKAAAKSQSPEASYYAEKSQPRKASQFSSEQWAELLKRVKIKAPALYTALRLAEPTLSGDTLQLTFAFVLHQKKVLEARHLGLIRQTIEEMTGNKILIKCSVDKGLVDKPILRSPTANQPTIDLRAINNIFGSAEVLES